MKDLFRRSLLLSEEQNQIVRDKNTVWHVRGVVNFSFVFIALSNTLPLALQYIFCESYVDPRRYKITGTCSILYLMFLQ